MRFTTAFAAGAFAVAASAQETKDSGATKTMSIDPVQSSILACVDTCDPTDIGCLAGCNPVPNPDEDQVADTHDCISDCDQGDGTEAQTERYAQCLATCVKQNYYDADNKGKPSGGSSGGSGGSSDDEEDSETQTTGTATVTTGANMPPKSTAATETVSETSGGDATGSGEEPSETGESGSGSSDDSEGDDDSAATGLIATTAALFGAIAAVMAL